MLFELHEGQFGSGTLLNLVVKSFASAFLLNTQFIDPNLSSRITVSSGMTEGRGKHITKLGVPLFSPAAI